MTTNILEHAPDPQFQDLAERAAKLYEYMRQHNINIKFNADDFLEGKYKEHEDAMHAKSLDVEALSAQHQQLVQACKEIDATTRLGEPRILACEPQLLKAVVDELGTDTEEM